MNEESPVDQILNNTPEDNSSLAGVNWRQFILILSPALLMLFLLFRLLILQGNVPANDLTFAFEHGNLASSLVNGRGLSNPFGINWPETGEIDFASFYQKPGKDAIEGPVNLLPVEKAEKPDMPVIQSNWISPLYAICQAAIFSMAGDKSALSAAILFIFKSLFWAGSLLLFLLLIEARNFSLFSMLTYSLLFVLLVALTTGSILETDVAFNSLFVALTFCVPLLYFSKPCRKYLILLFFVILLAPFVSPAIFIAFLLLLLILFWINRSEPIRKLFAVAFVLTIMIECVWIFYSSKLNDGNGLPKSNMWHEFYQAQAITDDGVYRFSTFHKHLPLFNADKFVEYHYLGENNYLRQFQRKSLELLDSDTTEYIRRVMVRLMNIILFMEDPFDMHFADVSNFTAGDLDILLDNQIVSYTMSGNEFNNYKFHWLNMSESYDTFKRNLIKLRLEDNALVIKSWLESRRKWQKLKESRTPFLKGIGLSLFPFVCALFCLLTPTVRKRDLFVFSSFFLMAYFLPYLFIAYYQRYHIPLLGILIMFPVLLVNTAPDSFVKQSSR